MGELRTQLKPYLPRLFEKDFGPEDRPFGEARPVIGTDFLLTLGGSKEEIDTGETLLQRRLEKK